MPREVKVLAMLVHAPLHWGVEKAANGGSQVRAVAAVPSKAAFLRLLDEAAGGKTSPSTFNHYGGETGNATEVEAAMSEPGVLFHQTSARVYGSPFVRAEMKP